MTGTGTPLSVPPGGSLALQPGWVAASAQGNQRWLQISTLDAVLPQISLTDPDGNAFATIVGGQTALARELLQGPATPPVVQSYQCTCGTARADASQQPPLTITFLNGATAPMVVLVEYAP
jgi:hypothetical protein